MIEYLEGLDITTASELTQAIDELNDKVSDMSDDIEQLANQVDVNDDRITELEDATTIAKYDLTSMSSFENGLWYDEATITINTPNCHILPETLRIYVEMLGIGGEKYIIMIPVDYDSHLGEYNPEIEQISGGTLNMVIDFLSLNETRNTQTIKLVGASHEQFEISSIQVYGLLVNSAKEVVI